MPYDILHISESFLITDFCILLIFVLGLLKWLLGLSLCASYILGVLSVNYFNFNPLGRMVSVFRTWSVKTDLSRSPSFTEVTSASGIKFSHWHGAEPILSVQTKDTAFEWYLWYQTNLVFASYMISCQHLITALFFLCCCTYLSLAFYQFVFSNYYQSSYYDCI